MYKKNPNALKKKNLRQVKSKEADVSKRKQIQCQLKTKKPF